MRARARARVPPGKEEMISKEGQTRVYGFVQLIVLEYSVDIFDIRDLDSDSVCIGVVRAFAFCVRVHGYVYVIHPEPTARRKKVMGATVCCSFIVH